MAVLMHLAITKKDNKANFYPTFKTGNLSTRNDNFCLIVTVYFSATDIKSGLLAAHLSFFGLLY